MYENPRNGPQRLTLVHVLVFRVLRTGSGEED